MKVEFVINIQDIAQRAQQDFTVQHVMINVLVTVSIASAARIQVLVMKTVFPNIMESSV